MVIGASLILCSNEQADWDSVDLAQIDIVILILAVSKACGILLESVDALVASPVLFGFHGDRLVRVLRLEGRAQGTPVVAQSLSVLFPVGACIGIDTKVLVLPQSAQCHARGDFWLG
jgi:hypothetical protein